MLKQPMSGGGTGTDSAANHYSRRAADQSSDEHATRCASTLFNGIAAIMA
jgi:hypothetical protein